MINDRSAAITFTTRQRELLKIIIDVKRPIGSVELERTELSCEVHANGEGSMLVVDAFPLDVAERKLMFGVLEEVITIGQAMAFTVPFVILSLKHSGLLFPCSEVFQSRLTLLSYDGIDVIICCRIKKLSHLWESFHLVG